MRLPRTLLSITLAMMLGVTGALVCSGSNALADPPADEVAAARQHQQTLEARKLKFLREHSDPSGKVRPDLERKGLAHARQMPVAAYIGERAPAPADKK